MEPAVAFAAPRGTATGEEAATAIDRPLSPGGPGVAEVRRPMRPSHVLIGVVYSLEGFAKTVASAALNGPGRRWLVRLSVVRPPPPLVRRRQNLSRSLRRDDRAPKSRAAA